jgi:hypothetical protein
MMFADDSDKQMMVSFLAPNIFQNFKKKDF